MCEFIHLTNLEITCFEELFENLHEVIDEINQRPQQQSEIHLIENGSKLNVVLEETVMLSW